MESGALKESHWFPGERMDGLFVFIVFLGGDTCLAWEWIPIPSDINNDGTSSFVAASSVRLFHLC